MPNRKMRKHLIGLLLPVLSGCGQLGQTPFSLTMEHSESKYYREQCERHKAYYQCMEKALNKAPPRIQVDDMPEDMAELMDIYQEFSEDLLDYIHCLQTDCQPHLLN